MSWLQRRREARQAANAAHAAQWEERKAAYAAQQAFGLTPEGQALQALKEQKRQDFWLGVRIAGGVMAGVAIAKTINGAVSAPNGWAQATWANQNGVQL